MKKCKNGHYYADELDHCPYCAPESEQEVEIEKTQQAVAGDKTKVFGGGKSEEKTSTQDFGGLGNGFSQSNDNSGKTVISIPDEKDSKEKRTRAKRKLVGWIVSYTIDELGYDYKLYEGKNVIGTDADCEITVPNDHSVSGKHATILFRGGAFMIKDEFSTNGTFVNDKMLTTETPILKDGDIIKVGNTIFKFKIAI